MSFFRCPLTEIPFDPIEGLDLRERLACFALLRRPFRPILLRTGLPSQRLIELATCVRPAADVHDPRFFPECRVALIAIGLQVALEPQQKSLGDFCTPRWVVLVEEKRMIARARQRWRVTALAPKLLGLQEP